MAGSVLIVDDEVQLVRHLEHLLRSAGYEATGVHTGAAARTAVESMYPDVVLVDRKLPDADGTELMTELAAVHPKAGYIIITAHGSISSAVEATKKGALDYLTKPFEPDELLVAVRNAVRDRLKEEEISVLRKAGKPRYARRKSGETGRRQGLDSRSPAMQATLAKARQAGATDSIILLLGESGTGKDYLARYIHENSMRSGGPFFTVNCAAVAPDLAESELFGHEPGAFTGARGRKRGLLELAENGTLLLNEIGELSIHMQAKLLTFLDARRLTRVGGETQITVNARLIAATNKELEHEVSEGRFRRDLFYRLNVLTIRLPPLRERIEDLEILTADLLDQLAEEMGLHDPPQIESQASEALSRYDWPGNVRELRNVIERALMLSGAGVIKAAHLGLEDRQEHWTYMVSFPDGGSLHDVTKDMKRSLLLEALRRTKGNRQDAAKLLGISRHALAYQMKSTDLEPSA